VIIADTGAIVGLIDADDQHHLVLRRAFENHGGAWVLPWAILPEVDYLLLHHVGLDAELAFIRDLAAGRWTVEWGDESDVTRAVELCERHASLRLGLVDGVVMSVAERLRARAIATLDERHFGSVELRRPVSLVPRDL
jgi:predicted nucleic acid-binding protein